jgi:hypothetical protein
MSKFDDEFDCKTHQENKDEIWMCLSCYDSEVAEQERERIIKLLDTDFWHHRIWGNPKPTCIKDCPTCELIALIKGENK